MTNVVELNSHLKHPRTGNSAATRAAVVADLVTLSAGVQEVVGQTLDLSSLSLEQLEYVVQHLVDAVHSLEKAANVLTDDEDWEPF